MELFIATTCLHEVLHVRQQLGIEGEQIFLAYINHVYSKKSTEPRNLPLLQPVKAENRLVM
jgi:hypothetical protein